ncbi:hypothetical protein, partial [Clostridioides difficile]|uniref:hypothetical protein n=1 Tax=Clostridioides difficile TaxID=1496 RepID=UPI000BDC789A
GVRKRSKTDVLILHVRYIVFFFKAEDEKGDVESFLGLGDVKRDQLIRICKKYYWSYVSIYC